NRPDGTGGHPGHGGIRRARAAGTRRQRRGLGPVESGCHVVRGADRRVSVQTRHPHRDPHGGSHPARATGTGTRSVGGRDRWAAGAGSAQTAASGASVGSAESSGVGFWCLGAAAVGNVLRTSAPRGLEGFGSHAARSARPLAHRGRRDRGPGGVVFLRPVVVLLVEPCLGRGGPLGGAVTEPFEPWGTERVLR